MSTDFISIIVGGRRIAPRQPHHLLRSVTPLFIGLFGLIGLILLALTYPALALLVGLFALAVKFHRHEDNCDE